MNDYENAIEIKEVTKRYDGFTLDRVSFNVPKGSIMGFIGQNGAGKTTTINALLNIVKKDEGEIRLLGLDSEKDEYEAKKQIAAVFDELPSTIDSTLLLSIRYSGRYTRSGVRIHFSAILTALRCRKRRSSASSQRA